MLKILVTGATGFTGGHLAKTLLEAGHQVKLLVRDQERLPEKLRENCEIVEGDLRDESACQQAVSGVQTVYHIAALYRSEKSAKEFFDVNVTGTEILLTACQAAKVERIVHCSTVGVHGHLENPPGDENAPIAPGDPYQESKLEGERVAVKFAEAGMPISIFRPTGIYGPGDTRLLKFFRMVKKGQPLLGSGKPQYHLTHIDDLVAGIILCGTHADAIGEIFILGGPDAPTLRQWYDTIAEVLAVKATKLQLPVWPFLMLGAIAETLCKPFGIEPPIHRRSVHFFTHDRAFTIDKAVRILGYAPKISLREGMEVTAEWYKKEGLL
jgi:nucleoside-diphosphate-sugar epimerase